MEITDKCTFCGLPPKAGQIFFKARNAAICQSCVEYCNKRIAGPPIDWVRTCSINFAEKREKVTEQPNNPAAHFALGMSLWLNFPEQAIESFLKVIELEPSDSTWKAQAKNELGIFEDDDTEIATHLRGAAHQQIALMLRKLSNDDTDDTESLRKNIDTIEYHYRKSVELYPMLIGSSYDQLASTFEKLGRLKEAIALRQKIIETGASNWITFVRLAKDHAHFGEFDISIDYVKRAIKADPRNGESWKLLIELLSQAQRTDELCKIAMLVESDSS